MSELFIVVLILLFLLVARYNRRTEIDWDLYRIAVEQGPITYQELRDMQLSMISMSYGISEAEWHYLYLGNWVNTPYPPDKGE